MNLFRILASGRAPFKEEAASAFLAYLLSPKMDHGLGPSVLAGLLSAVSKGIPELGALAEQLDTELREDLFEGPGSAIPSVGVTLEQGYNADKSGFIDIVVRCSNWFIAIENKLNPAAYRKGQVGEQYRGLRARLAQDESYQSHRVLMLYLVPALPNPDDTWSVPADARAEVAFPIVGGDSAMVMTWQPCGDETPSIVGILRGILAEEGIGAIAPMSAEIRQALLALIDFALGEFRGYPHESALVAPRLPEKRVGDLLASSEEGYVGVQYGLAGLVRQAWRKPVYRNSSVPFSETPRGWQYVPLADFRPLASWAMQPDQPLADLAWDGKPFNTSILYLVAKAAGPRIYIGLRGGLAALKQMSPAEIAARKGWELAAESRNARSWVSGTEFCRVLEEKGIKYDKPED